MNPQSLEQSRQYTEKPSQSGAQLPSQEQPPRRVSNLVSESSDLPSRRDTLDDAMEVDDMIVSSSNVYKEVTFSEYSSLHVYQVGPVERQKAYSSTERKAFQIDAFREATRIQGLIASCPYEGGEAIRYLLNFGLINPEELVGIENLICGRSSSKKVSKERYLHTAFVLERQRELREKNEMNSVQKLAATATTRSLKSVEKARFRAALAA
ncbi:hypothetical protein HJC23_002267 [Cyclotella cryptica]|uniref:Uncharacterized protein n=1 Tax=Cyclotella cryptica TaxID=29204 RepID=A0ABD3QH76_9STRA